MARTADPFKTVGRIKDQADSAPGKPLSNSQFNYQVIYILARLEAMIPTQRVEALRRIGVFDENGKRVERDYNPEAYEKPKDIAAMTPEDQIRALTEKMITAMDAGMTDANAQMVGRVLDYLEKKAKEEALKTNIVLNFCPWLVPDEVADNLFDTAFDGITIDGMAVKAEEWRTIPEDRLIAQSLMRRAEWAKMPFHEYIKKVMDAVPAD